MSDEMDFDMEVVKNENAFASSTAEAEEKEDSESRSGVSRDADTSSADGRWSSGSEEPRETDSGESLAGSLRQHADSPVPGWDVVRLGDVLKLEYGDNLPERDREDGSVPVYGSNGKVDTHSEPAVSAPGLVLGRKGSIGEIVLSESPFWPIDTTYYITRKETSLNLRYLQNLLQGLQLESLNAASAIPGLNRNDVYNLRVIVPPLPEQRKIASVLYAVDQAIQKTEAIIEQKEKIYEGAKRDFLRDGYFDHSGRQNTATGSYPNEWRVARGDEVFSLRSGEFLDSSKRKENGRYPVYGGNGIMGYTDQSRVPEGTVVIGRVGAYCGNVHITVSPAWVTDNAILVEELSSGVKPGFLVHVLDEVGLNRFAEQSAQPRISQSTLRNLKIPIPSEEEQEKIVDSLRTMKEATESEMRYQNDLQLLKKGLMQDLLTGEVRTADKAIEVLDEVKAHG